MSTTLRIAALAVVASLVEQLAACAPRDPAGPAPLVVAIDTRPRVFDPRLATSDIDARITRLVFAGLTTVDTPDGLPRPLLAESVQRVGPTVVDVALRAGLAFHDGSTLDAADVQCTVRSLSAEAVRSPLAADWESVTVEVIDALHLRFTTSTPDPDLEVQLELGIVPCEAADRALDAAFDAASGPWSIASVDEAGSVGLRAAPDWFEGPSAVRDVELRVVTDPNARVLGLITGTIDIVQNGVPAPLLEVVAREPHLAIERGPAFRYSYLVFNLEAPGLADPNVRRALALSIDRDAIVRYRLGGAATLASGMLHPTHWAARPGSGGLPYDPAAAAALLERSGLRAGADGCRVRSTLRTSSNRLYRGIAGIIAAQARDAGICLEVRAYEWATFFADVKAGNFEVASLQWTSIVDPGHYAWAFHSRNIPDQSNGRAGGNRGRWRNERVDALLDRAAQTTDPDVRADLYAAVQAEADIDLPYVSLWHEDHVVVHRRDVTGFEIVPTGRFVSLRRVSRAGAVVD